MASVTLCQCGCGEQTNVWTRNRHDQGALKGDPKRYVNGHSRRRELGARLAEKFDIDNLGCWVWTASTRADGYGQMNVGGRIRLAHRVMFEFLEGPIPEGFDLDHLCRNPRCVNPDHLEPVTPRENILRGRGASAMNARKTHCVRGHAFAGDNLLVRSNGHRVCRACVRSKRAQMFARLGGESNS